MRIRSILRGIALTLVVCAFALVLSACGGSQRNSGIPAGKPADTQKLWVAPPFQAATDTFPDSALAELAAYPCPEGVDPALFEELKDALGEALQETRSGELQFATPSGVSRPGGRESDRNVSTPPTGDENRVDDLELTDNHDGTYTLSWHYKNLGDYDQNGTVGISDITPIAMHYGETYDRETEPNCLLAVIDGSENGEIDIADITPIAMYFGVDCAGYRIQGGNSLTGSFTSFRTISVEERIGDGRLSFSVEFSSATHLYLRVVPYDAQGEDGEPSDPVLVPGEPPEIASVSPTSGLEGENVEFSAEVESAVTVTYAWNFGGGAEPDTSSIAQPAVTLGAVAEYEAQLTVTSVFGEDVFPFTLTVNPAPPTVLSVSPTEGAETLPTQFTAEVTGTEPLTYAWDFGGGASPDTSDEATPTVTLGDVGEYGASLTVTNAVGDDTFPFALTVAAGVPPHVTSVSPLSGATGEEVTFIADVSGTPPFTYAWDFKGAVTGADTSAASPSGVWGDGGTYEDCSLAVTNAFGNDMHLFTLTAVSQPEWHTITVDSAGDVGDWTSLAIVNGHPAISYMAWTNYDLKYVRASDANGSSWGSPITVDSAGYVGMFTSLTVVNGNPAISYYDLTNGDLKYVRASDANGSSWGSPITVDSAGHVGWHTSLTVVNGNPAISYFDDPNYDLKYVRASDASGGSWGTPVTVDSGLGYNGGHTSLTVVNGNPAISYYDNTNYDLKYVRATDASGGSWGTPVIVDSTGDVGWYTSLAVVSGNPAISYFDVTNGDLKYVRASDANGESWGNPVIPDGAGGSFTSLAVVNGNPAISYYGNGLKYVRATDSNGTGWGVPQHVDSVGYVGLYTSLAVVNGNPAISYYDGTNKDLKFAIYY